MKKLSVVIPCYNSEKTIESVVFEIVETMHELNQYEYEIVLVNDCSSDNTYDVIRKIVYNNDCVLGVNLAKNSGQHAALMAGLRCSKGDLIACLDDDGQTPPKEMVKLLQKMEEDYDVVYASYGDKQHSNFRNWGSKINSKMTEIMLGKSKELYISSYFIAKRFVIDEVLKYEGCYPYLIGLVLRSTTNICNVEVDHYKRQKGTSGYTLGKLLSLWMNGFTSFSVKPLRIANYLGGLSALAGLLYVIVIVIRQLMYNSAPAGWSSITSIVLVLGGVILMVLGMIGEYVGRIYMCINSTPQYVIREIIGKKNEKRKD